MLHLVGNLHFLFKSGSEEDAEVQLPDVSGEDDIPYKSTNFLHDIKDAMDNDKTLQFGNSLVSGGALAAVTLSDVRVVDAEELLELLTQ